MNALRIPFLRRFASLAMVLPGLLTQPAPAATSPGPNLQLSVLHPEGAAAWDTTDALVLRVELRHPELADDSVSDDPLVLAPVGRAWTTAVSLRVTAPDGREATWPFARSGTSRTEPLTLDSAGLATMSFALTPDSGTPIAPGAYSVVAILELPDGTGWTGRSESEPLPLTVSVPPANAPGLEISVRGAAVLAVGDPWVVSLRLAPPLGTASESTLRNGYRFRIFDAAGRELPAAFDPAATQPIFPAATQLTESGFGPVLAVLPPAASAGFAPGTCQLEAAWSGPAAGQGRTNRLTVIMNPLSGVENHPDRARAVLDQQLGRSMALLWRAEFAATAELQNLAREAAPLLVAAQTRALDAFLASPDSFPVALALSEAFLLSGDFAGAQAFREVAESLHVPALDFLELAPDPLLDEMNRYRAAIDEAAARAPGRVLPALLPAIEAARPPDTSAQWAVSARASSEYRTTDFSVAQATGVTNVTRHGDNARAWAPKTADAAEEWLELTYATAVRARAVRVVQSFNPGTIVRIDLLPETGAPITVWTGPDRTIYAKGEIGLLQADFEPPAQLVKGVRIVLDTRVVAGWNEIDAVQLLAARATPAPRLDFRVLTGTTPMLEFPSWPAGFVLQRATRLAPADWITQPGGAPARFPLDGAPAFFRLRSSP